MKLQLIRNATLRLSYAGRELLVDPSLDPAGTWPPMRFLLNGRRNPVAELPVDAVEVVEGIDGVLVTHTHLDHFDDTACGLLASDTPVLHQAADRRVFDAKGLVRLTRAPTERSVSWLGLDVTRVPGRHGFGLVARAAGPVSGFVLRAQDEPTVYIAGDTVWCSEIEKALKLHKPSVIVLNAGDARTANGKRLIMDGDDVERVLQAAPGSTVIAVHLEAISHCVLTRSDLRTRFEPSFGSRFRAPLDGEVIGVGR